MISKTSILFISLFLAFVSSQALSTEAAQRQEMPLSEQLEGLPVEARLAYLRHLRDLGRNDLDLYFQLAVAFHEIGEADSAFQYYWQTLSVDPGFYKAYVNMGVLWDDLHRSDRALEMLDRALEIEPNDKLANAHAAYVLLTMKNYEESWKRLSRALEVDPEDAQSRFYLAIFFYECGIYREALVEWRRVAELSPGSSLASEAEKNISMIQEALEQARAFGKPFPAQGQ